MTALGSLARAVLPAALVEPLRDWLADRRSARELARFQRHPTVPPPHAVKVETVIGYGRRFGTRVLVETGTFEGEMARRCRHAFREVITIELDPELAARAARRLARFGNIRVVQGDSAARLPEVLRGVREPVLFWLDGHYSGAGTARGERDTPLALELEAIAAHPVRGNVILIDDARKLGQDDYPSLGQIERQVRAMDPRYRLEVGDDIVRCTRPTGRSG